MLPSRKAEPAAYRHSYPTNCDHTSGTCWPSGQSLWATKLTCENKLLDKMRANSGRRVPIPEA
jgi:hypothetical protein